MSETIEQLRDRLIKLELALQAPKSENARSSAVHSLRDDFFEFGSSGGIINKEMVLSYLGAETIDMTSVDFTLHVLADGVALLTYRSVKRFGGAKPPLYSNRSSLWNCTDGEWQMYFHQGTPTIPFEFDAPGSHQLKR